MKDNHNLCNRWNKSLYCLAITIISIYDYLISVASCNIHVFKNLSSASGCGEMFDRMRWDIPITSNNDNDNIWCGIYAFMKIPCSFRGIMHNHSVYVQMACQHLKTYDMNPIWNSIPWLQICNHGHVNKKKINKTKHWQPITITKVGIHLCLTK